MFASTRYLGWAFRFYGKVPYDLASSGAPIAPASEVLGDARVDIDDVGAYARLHHAIARYNDVRASDVHPALGTTQAIFLTYAALLSPGDEVLVETPGYEPLTRIAEGLGATVRTFARREEEGFALVPERIAGSIGPRTRAIVVTDLHNPTGVRADRAALADLAKIAEARDIHLVVDEVYAPFDDLPSDGIFRRSARKLGDHVIAIGSLTKCYGLGNHRVGWVLGSPEIIARVEAVGIATFGHLPLSHAAYASAAFESIPRLSKRTSTLVGQKREIVAKWVNELGPGVRWSAPEAGLFGMVTLPGRGELLPAIEGLAEKSGVLVAAGTFFGAPESFRLSWASLPPETLSEGLARLSGMLASAG